MSHPPDAYSKAGKVRSSTTTRMKWEEQQAKMHGCKYVDGVCVVHGAKQPVTKQSQPIDVGPYCTCSEYHYPHKPHGNGVPSYKPVNEINDKERDK